MPSGKDQACLRGKEPMAVLHVLFDLLKGPFLIQVQSCDGGLVDVPVCGVGIVDGLSRASPVAIGQQPGHIGIGCANNRRVCRPRGVLHCVNMAGGGPGNGDAKPKAVGGSGRQSTRTEGIKIEDTWTDGNHSTSWPFLCAGGARPNSTKEGGRE